MPHAKSSLKSVSSFEKYVEPLALGAAVGISAGLAGMKKKNDDDEESEDRKEENQ